MTFGGASSWAQRAYEAPTAIERERHTYVVNSHGTYSQTWEEAVRILTAIGAEFSDSQLKAIIFPKVAVGSLIACKVASRVHTSPYPGECLRYGPVRSPQYA